MTRAPERRAPRITPARESRGIVCGARSRPKERSSMPTTTICGDGARDFHQESMSRAPVWRTVRSPAPDAAVVSALSTSPAREPRTTCRRHADVRRRRRGRDTTFAPERDRRRRTAYRIVSDLARLSVQSSRTEPEEDGNDVVRLTGDRETHARRRAHARSVHQDSGGRAFGREPDAHIAGDRGGPRALT